MRRRAFIKSAGIFIPAITGLACALPSARRIAAPQIATSQLEPPQGRLLAWWKADSLSLNDTDPVETWGDSKGNGWSATQGNSGLRPIFRTNQLNGRPALRFDQDALQVGDVLSGKTEAEYFAVAKIDTDPPGVANITGGLCQFGVGNEASHYPWTDGIIYDNFCTTARKTVGDPTPALTSFRLYNVSSKAAEWTARLDGTQLFTTAGNTFSATVGNGGNSIGKVENQGTGTNYYVVGYIAELFLYDQVLNSTDRDSVESYIASKYGLTIA